MNYAQTIAMANDLLADGRAEDVVQMVGPLLAPINDGSDADTGQVLLHALMARVQVLHRGDVHAALDLLDPFDAPVCRESLDETVRAQVALWLGWAHARRNVQPDEEARALNLLDEAHELFRITHAPHGRCWALIGQAQAYFAIDEYHLMRRALDEAWSLHGKLYDVQARRWLHDLSVPAQRFQGHYEAAQRHVDALHHIDADWDDRRIRGHASAHQAALHYDLGRPPRQVVETAERAETLLRRLDGGADYPLLAAYHAHVGALLRQEEWEAAEATLDEAVDAVRDYPTGRAHLQTLRARLALRRDDVERAEALLEDLFEQAHHLPHGLQRSHVALLRGQLLVRRGAHDAAQTWMKRAYRNARETGHRGNQLRTLLTLAEAALDRGDVSAAAAHVDATASYDDYFGVLPYAVLRFRVLGTLAHAEGRSAEAHRAFEQARSAAALIGDRYRHRRIQEALSTLDRPTADRSPDDVSASETSSVVRDPALAYESSSGAPALERRLGSALAEASLSVRLVAEAWMGAVEELLPNRWIALYGRRSGSHGVDDETDDSSRPHSRLNGNGASPFVSSSPDSDAAAACVHAHGSPPTDLRVAASAADDRPDARAHWLRLHTDPPFDLAVERKGSDAPDASDTDWDAALQRLSPWTPVVELALDRALLRRQKIRDAWESGAEPSTVPLDGFVCESAAMTRVGQRIQAIHASHSPVLVTGERGTGKSKVARAVHATSERSDGPLVVIRCASMQKDPLSERLFGRTASGSSLTPGAVHEADGGTLLLEDVDALPLPVQAKLVQMLDDGEVFPVGASAPTSVDVRAVATTSTDLSGRVQSGEFRDDLYFLLTVLPLRLPPLRQRREDIPLLVRHFLDTCGPEHMPTASITNRALDALLQYDWPGNVRQLRNEIERALVFVSSEPAPTVDLPLLSDAVREGTGAQPPASREHVPVADALDDSILHPDATLSDVMARAEKSVIEHVLHTCDGQVSASAEVLGLTRQGLYKKMKRLGIDASSFQPSAEPASAS